MKVWNFIGTSENSCKKDCFIEGRKFTPEKQQLFIQLSH